jgi:hypothetical protein
MIPKKRQRTREVIMIEPELEKKIVYVPIKDPTPEIPFEPVIPPTIPPPQTNVNERPDTPPAV